MMPPCISEAGTKPDLETLSRAATTGMRLIPLNQVTISPTKKRPDGEPSGRL